MNDWLLVAGIAGVAMAVTAAPLGCFVVWRRMAYFGDALAHAALLGVGLGLLFRLQPAWGIVASGIGMALLLTALQRRQSVAIDSLIGILSYTAFAASLLLIGWLDDPRIDLMAYLFGDLLALQTETLPWLLGGCALVLLTLLLFWRPLLRLTVHEDLARTDGLPTTALQLLLLILMAVVVALAMPLVGILLITALLIIPPATAHRFAHSPESMALIAAGCGSLSVAGGLGLSLWLDLPAGPAIVCSAASLYFLSLLRPKPL